MKERVQTAISGIAPITTIERETAIAFTERDKRIAAIKGIPSPRYVRFVLAYESALIETEREIQRLNRRILTEQFNHEACEHESDYQRQRAECAERKIYEAEST